MAQTSEQFWNLIAQSRLMTPAQIQHYQGSYAQAGPADPADLKALVQWLVRQNVISVYQAKVLLSGKPGPFFFGEYRVYDRISKGPLNGWFRAVHSHTGHPVMLEFLTGPAVQAWAQAVAAVQRVANAPHANLARLFEAIDLTTHKFLVWEDLQGESLAECAKPLAVDRASAAIRQAALAAAHLHAHGLVHGDIRPANIWLNPEGQTKLLYHPLTETRVVTPERADYAAPELAQAGATPTHASDIYALGCSLYETFRGQPPFPGGDVGSKLTRHANQPVDPLENFQVPKTLADAVMYMMAKNVGVRFATIQQVVEQLTPFAMSATPQSPPPAPPTLPSFTSHLEQKRQAGQAVAAPASTTSAPVSISVIEQTPSTQPAVAIADAETEGASLIDKRRARAKKGPPMAWIGGGVAAAVLLILLLVALLSSNGDSNGTVADGENGSGNGEKQPGEVVGQAPDAKPENGEAKVTGNPNQSALVEDDGNTLWNDPTSGEPINMAFVPADGQLVLVLRPSEMLQHPRGKQSLDALDLATNQSSQSSRDRWEKSLGAPMEEIEQLIISLHGNDGRYPRMNYVVRLKNPRPVEELRQAWGAGEPQQVEGNAVYTKGLYAYHPAGDGSVFVMGAPEDVKDVASRNGAPPPARRELELLRKKSDQTRHITILFAPNFFQADGLPLFEGAWANAREPLRWILGDGLQAGSFSLHFEDDRCYGEARLISEAAVDSSQLASQLRERIAQIPSAIEDYLATRVYPPEYWRKIALRLPGMVQFLHDQLRIGSEDGNAVVNFYMPAQAAPNLMLGGSLLILSTPSSGPAVAANTPQTPTQGPATLSELLKSPGDYAFDQQSLEFAMRDLAAEFNEIYPGLASPLEIRILGGDLQLEGITRNQQVRDVKFQSKPLEEMLTTLVMKANPVTTVVSPTETDQKLIWVVWEDPEAGNKKVILITTRKAAETKGYKLPAVFTP